MNAPTAIDLFSGAGGASLGLVRAGFDLRLAADRDPMYGQTHAANLPGAFMTGDLREVDPRKVLTAADLVPGELDVLVAVTKHCRAVRVPDVKITHAAGDVATLDKVPGNVTR